MEVIETLFLFLTFCLGMVGLGSAVLKLLEIMLVFMILTFISGIVTIYISCKNTDK